MAPRLVPALQSIVSSGLLPVLTAPSVDGDNIPCGNIFLWVENAAGAPITVTIQTPATMAGLAVAEAGGPVANGTRRLFGPFPKAVYGQPAGQIDVDLVRVDYSAITSITRGIFST